MSGSLQPLALATAAHDKQQKAIEAAMQHIASLTKEEQR
jgi:hypothetical protein